VHELYDPASPTYQHYLTVTEFTERFGPTPEDYAAVQRFATTHGLQIRGVHANRMVVDVGGSVTQLERALATTLNVYQHPTESRSFFAPSIEPSVDPTVPIYHVSGLDDFAPPRPKDLRRAPMDVRANNTGSGPNSTFVGNDFRAAYVPGVKLDGTGQRVGLFEFGPYNMSDVKAWFDKAGLPINVPITNVLIDKVSPNCNGCDDGEEVLDIDMAIAMAPGLTELLVYEGKNATDIFNRMATDNSAKQLSCSFGFLPPDPNQTQIFLEFAAQGQNLFVASGDTGANSTKNPVFAPADDPNVVVVGGTALVTNGPGGAWQAETAWSGSQGGIGTNGFGLPDYQTGVITAANQGSTTLRNIPDVASDAEPNIYSFANGKQGIVGGTSAAAPTWAGFLALVNQQAAQNGKPPVGFLNPILYRLGQSASASAYFHDITVGNNFTAESPDHYSAVTGYDLVTGWGSPTGQALIDQLAGTASVPADMAVSPDLATPPDMAIAPDQAAPIVPPGGNGGTGNGGTGNGGAGNGGTGNGSAGNGVGGNGSRSPGGTSVSGGCAVGGSSPSPAGLALLGLAWLALVARRRRSRICP
jgi:MYXO-CTERM domain-containing protein